MAHPYWPLFDLRIDTPDLELRLPTEEDGITIAALGARGVHDPAWSPFEIPWTDVPSPQLERNTMQWLWRNRAEWSPEKWNLTMMVSEKRPDGSLTVVGVQDLDAEQFAVRKTVHSGSWLGLEFQGRGIGKEMRAAVLHLGFAGLGAERAETGAWSDNAASLGVTRALGYEPNGDHIAIRRGVATQQLDFAMTREQWTRREDITLEGLEPCLGLFGVESES